MKLKKLLALALAGVLMLALLTGCSGGASGTEEDRLVAVGVADIFKGNSQNVEVSYSVPALTRTIRPAFTPDDGSKRFILFSEEYKKSEPFSYWKKVRILLLWCTSRDSNPGPTD